MILYRNIGFPELIKLLNREMITGHCANKDTILPAVCFFQTPYIWKDNTHRFFIILKINNTDPRILKQTDCIYHLSDDFQLFDLQNQEKIREKELRVSEVLLSEYKMEDIIGILT